MAAKTTVKLARKSALGMDEVIAQYIKEMKISAGLNTQLIFKAWDQASGASGYTIGRFFRDGKLYITLNSSVVRNQLSFQLPTLLQKVNLILQQDSLFVKDDPRVSYVKEIILK